jgi:hypothetical protein
MAIEQTEGNLDSLEYSTPPGAQREVTIQLPDGKDARGPRASLIYALAGTSEADSASRTELLLAQFGSDDWEFISSLNSDLSGTRALIRPFGFDILNRVTRSAMSKGVESAYYLKGSPSTKPLRMRIDFLYKNPRDNIRGKWEEITIEGQTQNSNGSLPDSKPSVEVFSANGPASHDKSGVRYEDVSMVQSLLTQHGGLLEQHGISLPSTEESKELYSSTPMGSKELDISVDDFMDIHLYDPQFEIKRYVGLVRMLRALQNGKHNEFIEQNPSTKPVFAILDVLRREHTKVAEEILQKSRIKADLVRAGL